MDRDTQANKCEQLYVFPRCILDDITQGDNGGAKHDLISGGLEHNGDHLAQVVIVLDRFRVCHPASGKLNY